MLITQNNNKNSNKSQNFPLKNRIAMKYVIINYRAIIAGNYFIKNLRLGNLKNLLRVNIFVG